MGRMEPMVYTPRSLPGDEAADTGPALDRIQDGKSVVLAELQRGDSKAASLLGFFGAVLAGVIALTRTGVSTPAVVLLYLAVVPTAAAVVLLLWTVKPHFGGGAHAGFFRWALFVANPAALVDDLDRPGRQTVEDHAYHLAVLSVLALTKYRRIATAVVCLLPGLALTALALLAA